MTEEREIEELFYFFDPEQAFAMIYDETLREIMPITGLLPTSIILALLIKDNNNRSLSSLLSDDNIIPLVRYLIKICHKSNRYDVVAHYKALSTIAQNEIYKSFSYNEAI